MVMMPLRSIEEMHSINHSPVGAEIVGMSTLNLLRDSTRILILDLFCNVQFFGLLMRTDVC